MRLVVWSTYHFEIGKVSVSLLYIHGPKFIDFFSVSCENHSKWNFLGVLELGIKADYFYLNMWNISYLGPAVTVQCPQTISNLSNFRCPPKFGAKCEDEQFRQFIESVIRVVYLSLEIWNITRVGAAVMVQFPKTASNLSNLLCPIRPRKPNSACALGAMGTILPIPTR